MFTLSNILAFWIFWIVLGTVGGMFQKETVIISLWNLLGTKKVMIMNAVVAVMIIGLCIATYFFSTQLVFQFAVFSFVLNIIGGAINYRRYKKYLATVNVA